ncbi:hypothetical protein LSUB1_G001815 [Lachnellula subtilissima]|uniref:Uncharacterized protein n=1 Tax=Lachnellula subtilissima TaxID=602034 RepID=A0A8H8UDY0_9HELO|nr:hypothetical protein LSUB1_G001815 [Lachnellula subtilissima]
MSFIYRTSRFAAARPVFASPSRAFTSSSMRALKESDRHNPDAAEANEKHKQDQLQKQKDGKGHWKPELASDSEEAITADRHEGHGSIEEMQKKTADHAEKKHKYGTSQDPGL